MNIYKLCLKNLAIHLPLINFLRETVKKVQYNFQEKKCLAMHSSQLLLDDKQMAIGQAAGLANGQAAGHAAGHATGQSCG
jgi:hypothetical protein